MAKKLTKEQILSGIATLSTTEQIEVKEATEKILADKKAKAEEEYKLINGGR